MRVVRLSNISPFERGQTTEKKRVKKTTERKMSILVTGGAGFIGSHTVVALYEAGYRDIVVIDNYSNSSPEALTRVERICNDLIADSAPERTSDGSLVASGVALTSSDDKKQSHSKLTSSSSLSSSTTTTDEEQERPTTVTDESGYISTHRWRIIRCELDLANTLECQSKLSELCKRWQFDCCVHFAALKAVAVSLREPLEYYRNNLLSTMNLLEQLYLNGCRKFVFSSSATVYGNLVVSPVKEDCPVSTAGITNPYGRSKLMIEDILRDFCVAKSDFHCVLLRYFNPIGAHPSGLIGEDPSGVPNNLMPFLSQVAVGRRPKLTVFGDSFDTVDGTGVRDYVHVMDLAEGHVLAVQSMNEVSSSKSAMSVKERCRVYNLGTGRGTSVMELLRALEEASGRKIPFEVGPHRDGDVAIITADCSKAASELGFVSKRTVKDMCTDAWKWQSENPSGYATATGVTSKD